jgi:pantoate--beta-alanine ligase
VIAGAGAGRPVVARTREELRAALAETPRPRGLVPTMGALHDGHLSLLRRARGENATVVISIFVNPTQFEDAADLAAYPRDLDADLDRCREAGVDIAFVPTTETIYPAGASTTVDPGPIGQTLEGTSRSGHFPGVATVVSILLGLVSPDRSYFGAKDAQQLVIVRRIVRDLALPGTIVGCPTVREPDGLAMSSRNARLGPQDRAAAVVLRRALLAARDAFAGGTTDAEALRAAMRSIVAREPRATLDYASVADPDTLDEAQGPQAGPLLLSLAAVLGGVRLIDAETVARG